MQSLSLVMSECSLSGRGQGHVSSFYIMDLENFATASRRVRYAEFTPRPVNQAGAQGEEAGED